MDFKAKIEELMKQKQISIAKLTRLADMNYLTLYNFLKGRSQMGASNLEKLFNILNEIK